MKITKQKLREVIKEQIDLLIEQEATAPASSTERLPPDVERDLKTGFASRFDELVKTNALRGTSISVFEGGNNER